MTEEDETVPERLLDPEWRMQNILKYATEKREDTDVIVQHPVREESPESVDAEFVEVMGLSVGSNGNGVVTIQNTTSDTSMTERFVAFDAELIDGLVQALEDVKRRENTDE